MTELKCCWVETYGASCCHLSYYAVCHKCSTPRLKLCLFSPQLNLYMVSICLTFVCAVKNQKSKGCKGLFHIFPFTCTAVYQWRKWVVDFLRYEPWECLDTLLHYDTNWNFLVLKGLRLKNSTAIFLIMTHCQYFYVGIFRLLNKTRICDRVGRKLSVRYRRVGSRENAVCENSWKYSGVA